MIIHMPDAPSPSLPEADREMPTFASVEEENHWLRSNRDTLQHEIAELRLNNAILTNTLYGRKSEKVRERDQEIGQQRLFEQPVADDATVFSMYQTTSRHRTKKWPKRNVVKPRKEPMPASP